MQVVRNVKTPDEQSPVPNADGVPEQVLVSLRWSVSTEILTSDAVFETMQGK